MTASKGVMILHPDDRAWLVEAYKEAHPYRAPFSAKIRVRRRGHAYRWMLFYGTPAFGQDGEFTGYVGLLKAAPKTN
jgi:hypothetical protein